MPPIHVASKERRKNLRVKDVPNRAARSCTVLRQTPSSTEKHRQQYLGFSMIYWRTRRTSHKSRIMHTCGDFLGHILISIQLRLQLPVHSHEEMQPDRASFCGVLPARLPCLEGTLPIVAGARRLEGRLPALPRARRLLGGCHRRFARHASSALTFCDGRSLGSAESSRLNCSR